MAGCFPSWNGPDSRNLLHQGHKFLNLRKAIGVTSLDPVLESMLNPNSVAAVNVKALSETEFEYGRFSP
jgi:hypothetical protein